MKVPNGRTEVRTEVRALDRIRVSIPSTRLFGVLEKRELDPDILERTR